MESFFILFPEDITWCKVLVENLVQMNVCCEMG